MTGTPFLVLEWSAAAACVIGVVFFAGLTISFIRSVVFGKD